MDVTAHAVVCGNFCGIRGVGWGFGARDGSGGAMVLILRRMWRE